MPVRRDIARRSRGFTIIEALVSLVVLCVGLLGVGAMFLESIKANRTALIRTSAVQLVNDMADRIRANRTARDLYAIATTNPPTNPGYACSTADCTPSQLAAFDRWQWYQAVLSGLPKGPDGSNPRVEVVVTPGATTNDTDTYRVVAEWKEPGATAFLRTQLEVQQLGGDP